LIISLFLSCFRYYPYYYAPFAYDFLNLKVVSLNFDQNTKPFRPFEQMMATFSPQNVKYLPPQWQSLMLNENSPIIEFYPRNFKIDPNDKKKSSQYVALIPFINENHLLEALETVYSTLTQEEEKRNTLDYDRIFIHSQNLSDKKFKELSGNGEKQITENNPIQLQAILNGRLFGYVWPDNNDNTINIDSDQEALLSDYKDISNNQVIRFKYRDPLFPGSTMQSQ
jgi:5'-3' exoribonuclease 2